MFLSLVLVLTSTSVALAKGPKRTLTDPGKIVVTGKIAKPDGSAIDPENDQIQVDVNQEFYCGPGERCGWGTRIDNAAGTFTITLERNEDEGTMSAGRYNVQARYDGSSGLYTPTIRNVIFMELGQTYDVGTLTLTKPVVKGVVKDPSGQTAIQWMGLNFRSTDWTVNEWANSNENGEFKIGGNVKAGAFLLELQAPQDSDYADNTIEVTITDPNTTLDLGVVTLATPFLTGTVVRPDGSALNADPNNCWSQTGGCLSANVRIWNSNRTIEKWEQTNNGGEFKFGPIATGPYSFMVEAPWGSAFTSSVEQIIDIVSGTPKDMGAIKLTSPQVTGTVYAPDGKTPVQNANVRLRTEDWKTDKWSNTNQNGVFYIGGLSKTGTYILYVETNWEHPEYISKGEKNITISDLNALITENLQYGRATKIVKGKVTRSNGQGVEAEVNAWPVNGGSGTNQRTSDDGSFTLLLGGGQWNIRPNVPWQEQNSVDWAYVGQEQIITFADDETEESQTVNFSVITTDAKIIGTVLDPNGNPATDANVNASADNGVWFNAQVQSEGIFELKVVGGTYRVNAWANEQTQSFPEKIVTVVSGQTYDMGEFKAVAKNARITGTLSTEDNQPIGGVRMNAYLQGGPGWSETTTNEDGTFAIPVFKGRWGVQFNQNTESRYVYDGVNVEVDIDDDNEQKSIGTVKMTFADVTITGQLLDSETKQPIPNFCSWVYARPLSDKVLGDKNQGPSKEYGGPVDCRSGKYTFYIPSKVASSVALGTHIGPNSNYSLEKETKVAITADQTYKVNVILVKNNAEFYGKLVDVDGTAISKCDFQGDVNFNEDETGIWHGSRIQSDCSYSVSLLGGKSYRSGYWMNARDRFLERQPVDELIAIAADEKKEMNVTVMTADATITGKVVDFEGKPVSHVGVNLGNWPEIDELRREEEEETEFKSEEDRKEWDEEWRKTQRELEIHNWAETDKNGQFTLGARQGHLYNLNVWFPPERFSNLVQPDDIEVNLNEQTKEVNFQLEKSLGTMSGFIRVNKVPIRSAWMWCWNEEGGNIGTGANEEGKYSVAYRKGRWHCGSESFLEGEFYRMNEEIIIDITDESSISQNFDLKISNFEVPPAVSTQFDPTQSQVITLENGTTIEIPANALGTDSSSQVKVTATPTVSFYRSEFVEPFGVGYELKAFDSSDTPIVKFGGSVIITFFYTEEQLEDIGIDEETLTAQYQDDNGAWKSVEGGTVIDPDQNRVKVTTNHFTKYAMVSSGSGDGEKTKDKTDKTTGAGASAGKGNNILVTPEGSGGPQIAVWNKDGKLQASWFAFSPSLRMGIMTKVADLDGDGVEEVIAVPGQGSPSQIRIFSGKGKVLGQFFAYDVGFKEGIQFTIADVDKDKKKEIITVPSKNGSSNVRIYDSSGKLERQFNAYVSTFTKGALIAASDLDGNGSVEIVTAPAAGSSQIRVFNSQGSPIGQWDAYDSGSALRSAGIASLLIADMEGDGPKEIIVSPVSDGNEVRVFNSAGIRKTGFNAYASTFLGGARIAVGDVDGNGKQEFVALPNANGSAQVRVFDAQGKVLSQFFAYPPAATRKGVFKAVVADLDGNGKSEIVFGTGKDLGPNIRVFDRNGKVLSQFMALHPLFRGGVNFTSIQP